MSQAPRILYCHCAYAQVVPKEIKDAVLRRLSEAGVAFEAVADLCEMSARQDRTLQRLAADESGDGLKIAACFPRAVKWLFSAAGAPLNGQTTEVLNMRVLSSDDIIRSLLSTSVQPNLPNDKGANSSPAGETDQKEAPENLNPATPA